VKYIFNPFSGTFDADGLYFKENGYTLELWFKGVIVHSWTTDAPAIATGSPVGLLLAITHNLE
jgi:hypothetical protein